MCSVQYYMKYGLDSTRWVHRVCRIVVSRVELKQFRREPPWDLSLVFAAEVGVRRVPEELLGRLSVSVSV